MKSLSKNGPLYLGHVTTDYFIIDLSWWGEGRRGIGLEFKIVNHKNIFIHKLRKLDIMMVVAEFVRIVFKALATTLTVSLLIEPYQVRLKIPVKTDDCFLPADDNFIADAINQPGPSHVTTST
jgi:hypothetical protein